MKKRIWIMAILVLTLCVPALAEEAGAAKGIDLTAIINAAIALIGAILTYRVIPYLKEKMTDSQFARTMAAVNVAVYAAEEIYREGHGAEKLKYAQTYLRSKGYEVDIEEIKAAVKKMRVAEENSMAFDDLGAGDEDLSAVE